MRALLVSALIAISLAALSACSDGDQVQESSPAQPDAVGAQPAAEPLKIGFLVDLTAGLSEIGQATLQGFQLAMEHLNAAGGVFGRPVEFVVADTALDPTIAISEAERMIEVEGVHAIVGATASAISIAVAESVTGPRGVPQITGQSSSPQLALAEDDDFLFRTTLNDRVQGPVLAQIVSEAGLTQVGVLFRDDAWGQGIARAFAAAWPHQAEVVAVDPSQTSFLSELRQSARAGTEALVLLAFVPESQTILREALENDIYDRFFFGPTSRSFDLPEAIGAEHLAGMGGTAPGTAPGTDSAQVWEAAFEAEYGKPAAFPYVKQAYDATVALALAAAAAGSTEGTAIRDQLRAIGGAPGMVVTAGPESLREGLAAAARGEDIDYEGAAQSLEWDSRGDLEHGYVGIWEFTADGGIDDLRVIAY